jgi:hypothetical protein
LRQHLTGRGKLCPRRGYFFTGNAFSFSSGTFVAGIIAAVEGNGGITGLSAIDIAAFHSVFLPLLFSTFSLFVRSMQVLRQCADHADQSAE